MLLTSSSCGDLMVEVEIEYARSLSKYVPKHKDQAHLKDLVTFVHGALAEGDKDVRSG